MPRRFRLWLCLHVLLLSRGRALLDESKVFQVLDRLSGLTLAVVGDLFLDKYLEIDGRLRETSLETGLEAYQVARTRCTPGAGGTVLNNLAALGVGRLLAVSVLGDDGEGFELRRALDRRGVDLSLVIQSAERATPTYTKPMLDVGSAPPRELNRLDIKNRCPMPPALEAALIAHLERAFRMADGLVVADQVEEADHGVITEQLRDRLAELAAQQPDKVVLADSRARIGLFRHVWLKANRTECVRAIEASEGRWGASKAAGADTLQSARGCSEFLARRAGRPVYCTLGSQGMLYTDAERSTHIPAYPVAGAIDIVGAGDSATAGIICGLCTGLDSVAAGALGNLIASITIQQIGTTGTATPEQVLRRWREVSQ
ncbi:MAG: carbohydrate kinase [Planctomycetes bacterium]|nr:carbohydrate kinase [Planctomycetota bacterium]